MKKKKVQEKVSVWQQFKDYMSTTKLNYYLHKTISPKNTYLVALIIFSLFILLSYFSYAMFTVYEERQRVLSMQAGSLSSTISSDDFSTDTKTVTIPATSSKIIDITVNNNSVISAKIDLNCVKTDDVTVSYLNEFSDITPNSEGDFVLEASSNKKATISIINTSSEERSVTFSTDIGLENANLTGTNYVITNTTDNPYDSTTLAYRLRSNTKFVKEEPDFSDTEVTNDINREGTYYGTYVSGNYDGITYSCPEGTTKSDKEFVLDPNLYYCSPNPTCPANSFVYTAGTTQICMTYKKHSPDFYTLRTTEDEDGNIVYYYHGGYPADDGIGAGEHVKIGNILWKVLRINEDSSIRLIKASVVSETVKYSTSYSKYKFIDSNVKTTLDRWYNNNLTEYDNYLIESNYCDDSTVDDSSEMFQTLNGDFGTLYGANKRFSGITYDLSGDYSGIKASLFSPTLACSSENRVNTKIGLITIDEFFYAGHSTKSFAAANYDFDYPIYNFLSEKTFPISSGSVSYDSLFMSLNYSGNRTFHLFGAQQVAGTLLVSEFSYSNSFYISPVITLKPGIKYTSGSGTSEDPYLIS
ncbi:MAG: hypothetical protein ACI4OT_02095 [Bacilli bacterium]